MPFVSLNDDDNNNNTLNIVLQIDLPIVCTGWSKPKYSRSKSAMS